MTAGLLAVAMVATLSPGDVVAAEPVAPGAPGEVEAALAAATGHDQTAGKTLNELTSAWGGCASGPRLPQFAASMIMISASKGWSFKGICGAVRNTPPSARLGTTPYDYAVRPGALAVVFRNQSGYQYFAWYDTTLDRQGKPYYSGGGVVGEDRMNTPAGWATSRWMAAAHVGWAYESHYPGWESSLAAMSESLVRHESGCTLTPGFFCIGGNQVVQPDGTKHATTILTGNSEKLVIGFATIEPADSWFLGDLLQALTFAAAGYAIGYAIGIGLELGGALLSAFSSGVGSFVSGLVNGKDVLGALVSALATAAIAYVGRATLDAYGDPTGVVGVNGAGCPTGSECWTMRWMNDVPPLKNLAEGHDAFISWTEASYARLGSNPFFKAVTIPPFVVSGCSASPECVTAGFILAQEYELA